VLSARGQPPSSRARSVLAFLLPRGIASARLEARGYGARRPLARMPRRRVPNNRVELRPVLP
jgi:outer membrane protein OmpA-like peptidoglycan-associated protein